MSREKLTIAVIGVLLSVLLIARTAVAQDIDLFNDSAAASASAPNILFVIDNGAAWDSNLGTEKANQMVENALYQALVNSSNLIGKVNIGLMIFAKGSVKGGKVIEHVQPFTAAYQATLSCLLYNTTPDATTGMCPDTLGDEKVEKNNNTDYAMTFNEAYRYFAGLSPHSGAQSADLAPTDSVDPVDTAAFTSSSLGQYDSPALNDCGHNFIIFIGTGTPDSAENTTAESTLSALGGVLPTDPIPLTPSLYQSSWADEFARYLSTVDLQPTIADAPSITTYVVDVFDASAQQTNSYLSARAFFQSVAQEGKGSYFTANSASDIEKAISKIMLQVQSVNSVFASVSLPISVNVQGTNLNQVYIGMFRPDSSWRPLWYGNLKRYQYEFNTATGTPYLADANGNAAYNPVTGFINSTAASFWTPSNLNGGSGDAYWSYAAYTDPNDYPDGASVEKGAVSEYLRNDFAYPATSPTRTLYTCAGGCATSGSTMPAFDTSNAAVTGAISTALGSTATTTQVDDIVNWAMGQDVKDENNNGSTTDMRPTIHGDVLHSRPVVINYGNGTVVAYYGANGGFMHAVDGNTGHELWGFIPSEQIPELIPLYNDQTMTSSSDKPYFVDGNMSVYTTYTTDSSGNKVIQKAYLYLTMRRGGRMIYALDVTDPNNPKFLWEDSASTPGFSELGQTWSTPKLAYVSAFGTSKPVLIFGAGYDAAAEDMNPANGNNASRTMGRGLFMIDALTGKLLWEAGPNAANSGAPYFTSVSGMTYSIPSDVALVNVSNNSYNYAERIYVGDTGGNLWRADISNSDPSQWTVTQLASVGGCNGSNATNCRKFLYPPSVVVNNSSDVELLIGSGDRTHPFDTSVTNRFYMFVDQDSSAQTLPLTESSLTPITSSTTSTSTISPDGWYYTLSNPGEKVVGNALTMGGVTYFDTSTPPASQYGTNGKLQSCATGLGTAREYYLSATSGTPGNKSLSGQVSDIVPGGGFPPPPVGMSLKNPNTGDIWTGVGGLRPIELTSKPTGTRQDNFWFDSH